MGVTKIPSSIRTEIFPEEPRVKLRSKRDLAHMQFSSRIRVSSLILGSFKHVRGSFKKIDTSEIAGFKRDRDRLLPRGQKTRNTWRYFGLHVASLDVQRGNGSTRRFTASHNNRREFSFYQLPGQFTKEAFNCLYADQLICLCIQPCKGT